MRSHCFRLLSLLASMSLVTACTATPKAPPTPLVATATSAASTPATATPALSLTQPPAASSTAPPAAPSPTPYPYVTPTWLKTGVMYQVFVRSFYDTNDDGIGDLDGVTAKLDYIQSLGADIIWLNPIHPSPSYHGYDVTDYYAINPDFGTKQDLIELVEAAHARGMRVLLDYVANHMSNQNPIFLDAYGNPTSQYADWFAWKDQAHHEYASFYGIATLPQVNQRTPAARAYFMDVAQYWMDLDDDGDYTDGIDGFRCDYVLGPVEDFWKALRHEVKTLNPEFALVGETWVDSSASQVRYYQDAFDAQFDFPFFLGMMNKIEIGNDNILAGKGSITVPVLKDTEGRKMFPPEAIRVRFLSNHDTDRLATELSETPERLPLAAWLLATLEGTPIVYYGEEIGQFGHKGKGPIYDEYRREALDWYATATGEGQTTWFTQAQYTRPNDGISVEEQEANPEALLNTYRAAFAVRAQNPALEIGATTPITLTAEGLPRHKTLAWAFWRHTAEQQVMVVFNFGTQPLNLAVDLTTAPGPLATQPVNLVTGKNQAIDPTALPIAAGSFLILDWTP